MRKRILVFPFDLLAHYTRSIVLADHFDKHHEIEFAEGSYGDLVNENGYKTFQFNGLDPGEVMRGAARFDFSWLNRESLETVLEKQVKVISDLKPSLVIGDTSHTLKMAAELCKVRYVSIMNTYMSKYYSGVRRLPPVHPAFKYQQKIPAKYFDPVIKLAEAIAFRKVHEPFRKIRKNLGLNRTNNFLEEMEGDDNFLCDIPILFPHKPLPDNYTLIGPLLYQKGKQVDLAEQTRPLIYVSMGSSGNWKSLKHLNGDEYSRYVFVTTGDTNKVLSATHIINYGYIDPANILRKADLVICHGGNGTIYQALKHKVPVLVRPSNFEQYYNLDGLLRGGVGEELTIREGRETVEQIDTWIRKKREEIFQNKLESMFNNTPTEINRKIAELS